MRHHVLVGLLGLLLLPSALHAANEEGEVTSVTRTSFNLKNTQGKVFTFKVTEDLAKGRLSDPKELLYRNTLKDLRVGQVTRLRYRPVGKELICDQLRIMKQSSEPCPEPLPKRRKRK